MFRTASTLFLVMQLFLVNNANPQLEVSLHQNDKDIIFNHVPDLNQNPAAPSLIGGIPADPTDWPASFYSHSEGSCTSTLVGPQALLTAAHCVGNGKKATIRFSDGTQISGICTHAPNYPDDISSDYALCFMDVPVKDIPFEYINFDENLVGNDDIILLTGYGCTLPPGTGGNDGVYRIGEAKIIATPAADEQNPNYYVTQGRVALCFGDSGGAAFQVTEFSQSRVVISVNSRGNIRDLSFLSSTSSKDGKTFIEQWSNENSAAICGLSQNSESCR